MKLELKKFHLKEKIDLQKKDWVLIAIIIFVAGLAFLMHHFIGGKGAGCVTVKVEGEIQGVYSLAEDQVIEINDGTNILEIRNGTADVTGADCPDKLCVHQGTVSLENELIVCLPNRMTVRITGKEAAAK